MIEYTSRTLREALKGPDCDARQHRARELVAIYQPVWEETIKKVLRYYGNKNATLDASDVVGDQICQMLEPGSDYFRTYDQSKSVRTWIKACLRHRAIDLLRRKAPMALDTQPEGGAKVSYTVGALLDQREAWEIFRKALGIATTICRKRGSEEDMRIFEAVRSVRHRVAPERRRKLGWTEHQEREAVRKVWTIIRNEAIPAAAAPISDVPTDITEVCQWVWDQLHRRGRFSFPSDKGHDERDME